MKIGFIGLGNMGAPMAANLVAAGHEVTGFDVAGVTVEGVAAAASAVEAATGAEVVITMLPNGAILRSVAARCLPAMTPGAVLLDCSTVDVASARAVAAEAEAAGIGCARRPGLGRDRRGGGGHADLHGGRRRRGLRDRPTAFRHHGPEGGALRPLRATGRPPRSATT
jgi:3-hydroxyisobutyrate dehydrogenase-like beta-hydroxyacid dehydrogenase